MIFVNLDDIQKIRQQNGTVRYDDIFNLKFYEIAEPENEAQMSEIKELLKYLLTIKCHELHPNMEIKYISSVIDVMTTTELIAWCKEMEVISSEYWKSKKTKRR